MLTKSLTFLMLTASIVFGNLITGNFKFENFELEHYVTVWDRESGQSTVYSGPNEYWNINGNFVLDPTLADPLISLNINYSNSPSFHMGAPGSDAGVWIYQYEDAIQFVADRGNDLGYFNIYLKDCTDFEWTDFNDKDKMMANIIGIGFSYTKVEYDLEYDENWASTGTFEHSGLWTSNGINVPESSSLSFMIISFLSIFMLFISKRKKSKNELW
jgi:hypothetical protein